MIIKHYSGTNTPKPRFFIIFDYSEWSKNHRVFSLYMQDYMECIHDMVQGLKFQILKQNNGAFVRLATEMPANHEQTDLPIPLLIHGNMKE